MDKEKKKRIIDLRRFFENKAEPPDGMHTGMPAEYYYDDVVSESEQNPNTEY